MKHSLNNSDRLVIDHLNFARQFARAFCRSLPPHVDADAVESDALLGLIMAARAFDPHRGVTFTAYAKRRIRGAMLDGLRERQGRRQHQQHVRFLSLSTPMGDQVTLGDALADRSEPVGKALEQAEEIALLLRPARRLSRRLVREHFIEGYSQDRALPNRVTGAVGVPLIEKMYAFARTYSVTTNVSQNTYASLNYGSPSAVMRDLSIPYLFVSAKSTSLITSVMAALSRRQIMTANTVSSPPANIPIVPYHVYTVIGLNKSASGQWQFILNNPWNSDGTTPNPDGTNDGVITLREDQFRAVFNTVVISQLA